jgi:DNA-binding transcriptional ArsR family regulator
LNPEREDDLKMSDRDAEVVRAIEEEGLSLFTFDGLRRITGAHPETLSRALGRLEEDGIIVRSPDGYSTTDRTRAVGHIRPAGEGERPVPILHTFLPYGATVGGLVSALKGKWFDRMRWVGLSETEEGVVLKWVADDGSALIDVRMSGGQLDVGARVRREADLAGAVRAAHQLMGRISRLYGSPRPGRGAALMRIGYFEPYAM